MKDLSKEQFNFSRKELNGIIVLLVVGVLAFLLPELFRWAFPSKVTGISSLIRIEKFLGDKDLATEKSPSGQFKDRYKYAKTSVTLFLFDPNELDIEGWQKLGLSARQAMVIRKYIEKGGGFRKAEDLKKMYVIKENIYQRIAPFVRIEPYGNTPAVKNSYQPQAVKIATPVMQNINTADSAMLESLKGIGPAFARRIISYRNRLGGFVNKEQLLEVYGIDSLKFAEINRQVYIGPERKMINLNTATFDDLKTHPYLKYHQINAILQFRKQHGQFTSIDDLAKLVVLPIESIKKLSPYLSF